MLYCPSFTQSERFLHTDQLISRLRRVEPATCCSHEGLHSHVDGQRDRDRVQVRCSDLVSSDLPHLSLLTLSLTPPPSPPPPPTHPPTQNNVNGKKMGAGGAPRAQANDVEHRNSVQPQGWHKSASFFAIPAPLPAPGPPLLPSAPFIDFFSFGEAQSPQSQVAARQDRRRCESQVCGTTGLVRKRDHVFAGLPLPCRFPHATLAVARTQLALAASKNKKETAAFVHSTEGELIVLIPPRTTQPGQGLQLRRTLDGTRKALQL